MTSPARDAQSAAALASFAEQLRLTGCTGFRDLDVRIQDQLHTQELSAWAQGFREVLESEGKEVLNDILDIPTPTDCDEASTFESTIGELVMLRSSEHGQ